MIGFILFIQVKTLFLLCTFIPPRHVFSGFQKNLYHTSHREVPKHHLPSCSHLVSHLQGVEPYPWPLCCHHHHPSLKITLKPINFILNIHKIQYTVMTKTKLEPEFCFLFYFIGDILYWLIIECFFFHLCFCI